VEADVDDAVELLEIIRSTGRTLPVLTMTTISNLLDGIHHKEVNPTNAPR